MPKNKNKNKIKTGAGPIPDSPTVYHRNKTIRNNSNKAKQNEIVRSARRQALSSASAPLSTPRCHMPTFFAAVIQSRQPLTTTPNATHLRPLPLHGTAPKALGFFWGQSTQDVAGRPPRLDPCTASRPNMTRFESFASPCRARAPPNSSWRFRIFVSMRSEPVLSRLSPYDSVYTRTKV